MEFVIGLRTIKSKRGPDSRVHSVASLLFQPEKLKKILIRMHIWNAYVDIICLQPHPTLKATGVKQLSAMERNNKLCDSFICI